MNKVSIRTNERSLNKTQDIRRAYIARIVVFSPTIVAKIVSVTGIREVHTSYKVLEHIHISIKTDVQTVKVVLSCSSIALRITQREVIHSHIITTVYTHLIVLCKCIVIEVLLPISFVVIKIIEEVRLILIKERNCLRTCYLIDVRLCTDKFSNIVTILTSIHHLGLFGTRFISSISAEIDTSRHALTTTSIDEQNTIRTLSTITCGTVLNHLNSFDIIWIDNV